MTIHTTASSSSAADSAYRCDDTYAAFLAGLQANLQQRLDEAGNTVFQTDAQNLFDAYLTTIPEADRQYCTCACCRSFVNNFGGLVTIDRSGAQQSLLWSLPVQAEHQGGASAMHRLVQRARVTGPFLSSMAAWGQARTGEWLHMHVTPPKRMRFSHAVLTAGQAMADKRHDMQVLQRALQEFTAEHIAMAVQLLESEGLYRSEKVIGPAIWLRDLVDQLKTARSQAARRNMLWLAVATAPAGFCHPRTTMIGTLLEDIAGGLSYEDASKRFAAKMHPLRYQRPQAAPAAGNIAQAERLVEKMNLAPALERRIARVDEIPLLWRPRDLAPTQAAGGVFGGITPKGAAPASTSSMQLPAITMTLEKFARTVVPEADQIEIPLDSRTRSFIMLTAPVHADAPRLFQWDHPYSWYLMHGGTAHSQVNLGPGLAKVCGITRLPARWNDDGERFAHHGDGLVLLIEGAKETRNGNAALFPEQMRSELREVSATIEAHSKRSRMQELDAGNAIGYDLRKGGNAYPVLLRVTSGGRRQDYRIDRWD